jgi:hypothetical protein
VKIYQPKRRKILKKPEFLNNTSVTLLYEGCLKLANLISFIKGKGKGKGVPRQAEVAQGGSGRLRLRIFLTSGTMKVVRSSPLCTGRLYLQEYPGTHF